MIITYLNQRRLSYNNCITRFSKENSFANFLSIFRIYISFHIIKSVYLSWNLSSVFVKESDFMNYSFPKLLHGIIHLLVDIKIQNTPLYVFFLIFFSINLIFGYLKNLNFVFLFFLWKIHMTYFLEISNGGYNLLIIVLFLMCFTNSWRNFCFVNYKETQFTNFMSNLGVYSILIQLCLIYLVSGLNKTHSDAWFNGSATYYILNTIPYCSPIAKPIKDNLYFVIISTYFTLFIELFFWILIWIKQTRLLMIISGISLHLAIYLTMMLYDFQILFIFVYGFFINDEYWKNIINRIKTTKFYNYVQI